MRILFVSQEFPPETLWGGIGRSVDVLSRAMVAGGAEVHVLSLVVGQASRSTTRDGVVVHRRGLSQVRGPGRAFPELWRRLWLAANVARVVPTLGFVPDVIECPEWQAEGFGLALRGRVPLLVRLHSSAAQLFPHTGQGRAARGLDGRLAAKLEDTSARRANAVASTRANFAEVALRLRLDESASHVIPQPVDLPLASVAPPAGPPRVLFVGRLEPRKAPEVLLAAAPAVLASRPETKFIFAGRDGVEPGAHSSGAWLRAEADRLGVSHAVELVGHLGRLDLERELRAARLCAFPSRWESFGNVVAEAAAAMRATVVSDLAPFRELVQDGVTGRLVAGEDPGRWAAALLEFIDDPVRAAVAGEAAGRRIAQMSGSRHVAELTLAAMTNAVERWQRGLRAGYPVR